MSQFYGLLPIIENTTPDANAHRANFTNIQSYYNSHDKNKTLVHGLEGVEEISSVSYYTNILEKHNPVGTVIEVWDNEIEAVKALINSDIYTELDGKTINDEASLFNGITIPDSAEVYLRGTKTSSVLDTTIDGLDIAILEHNHTTNHSHDFLHNHSLAGHTHTKNRGYVCLAHSSATNRLYFLNISVPSWTTVERGTCNDSSYVSGGGTIYTGFDVDYTVASVDSGSLTSNSTNATSYDEFTFNNSLSATQDIRPSSIKCRRFLRYK